MVEQRHAHANHGSLEVAFPQSGSRRRASREHCHRPVRRPHDCPNASRRLHQNAHDEPRVLVLGLNAHRAVCVRHSLQARRSHQLPALARAGVRSGYASAAAARPMRSRVHRSSSSTTGKCRKRPPPALNYCRATLASGDGCTALPLAGRGSASSPQFTRLFPAVRRAEDRLQTTGCHSGFSRSRARCRRLRNPPSPS